MRGHLTEWFVFTFWELQVITLFFLGLLWLAPLSSTDPDLHTMVMTPHDIIALLVAFILVNHLGAAVYMLVRLFGPRKPPSGGKQLASFEAQVRDFQAQRSGD